MPEFRVRLTNIYKLESSEKCSQFMGGAGSQIDLICH